MDPVIVKKNSNEFSVAKEVLNEVNNLEFKTGEQDFYRIVDDPEGKTLDTQKSYIWSAISAVSDQVGEALYEKVLNFIDDVSDIDTCSVKSLQSMIQLLGTNFSAFKSIDNCPLELLKLIDIFSMRKDYLLKSDKVCQQMAAFVSSSTLSSASLSPDDIKSNEEREKLGLPLLSASEYMKLSALDNLISSTYYEVMLSNVNATYNTLSATKVYEVLSAEVLSGGFELPNKYADDIYAAKVRLNIPPEFDPSDEVDLIDQGLSSFDSYTKYEQEVLSIELKRRSDATNELEPRSRYSYYKEANVRDYFKFIEAEWNTLSSTYLSAESYDIDKTYLEVNSLISYVPLAYVSSKGDRQIHIREDMIADVAAQLLDVTTQIREIREYLKSHAQRTYMKGTWLLIAYAINEYLKSNIYPALNKMLPNDKKLTYDSKDTKIDLIEYIDQTQYSNIHTDIKEDKYDRSTNPEFWKGSGAEGSADSLDTTNIFRPEDKAKLVTTSTFSQDQIRDFYFSVLDTFKSLDLDSTRDTNNSKLYNFLSSVFSTGADNSWIDEYGKAMCELRNETKTSSVAEYEAGRKFTVDIDTYLRDLSAAYISVDFMLSGYHPIDNITIHTQLDDAVAEFKAKSSSIYDSITDSKAHEVQAQIDSVQKFYDSLAEHLADFNDLTVQYSNLTSNYLPYTGDFIPSTSDYFIDQLSTYSLCVNNGFVFQSHNIKNDLITQIDSLESRYNLILAHLIDTKNTTSVATDIEVKKFELSYQPEVTLDLELDYNLSSLSALTLVNSSYDRNFEILYDRLQTVLQEILVKMTAQLAQLLQEIKENILSYFDTVQYTEMDKLSVLLSSYYEDMFSLLSCVDVLSTRLDYTGTEWYKYKEELCKKYTGNKLGDTPYYQLENTKHPSYQIHPCLSNFIEKVDFTYPLQNLAGIAADTIEYIAKQKSKIKLDEDGYLLSVWCNPLNGNTDYLSRYEKTNHTDAKGQQNPLFGYDGPFYPRAVAEITAAKDSLKEDRDVESSWYKGLNISKLEKKSLYEKLDEFEDLIKEVSMNDALAEIIRYGLDAYGNSYTVIKSRTTGGKPTLWVKAKNHPYAFPAFVYSTDGKLNEQLSWIEEDAATSNTMIGKVDRISVGSYEFPIIEDFTFALDKTVILLNCKEGTLTVPVHCIIEQKKVVSETQDQFVRWFDQDPVSRQENLIKTDLSIGCFYYDGQRVGEVFLSAEGEKLSVLVDSYLKNENTTYIQTSATAVIDVPKIFEKQVKVDCQPDGIFSIAYVKAEGITQLTTFTDVTASYTAAETTSYITTHDKKIVTEDFQLFGSMLCAVPGTKREFLPYSEIGFIPLYPHNNNSRKKSCLSGTALQEDLDAGKPMKFELFGPASDSDHGIDFKFIVPMRVYEDGQASYTDVSYHRGVLGKPETYTSCVNCYKFDDAHYFESDFNKYLLGNEDATFWDSTEVERELYLSASPKDDRGQTVYSDFLKLAKYDVQQYLSALRDEDATSYDADDSTLSVQFDHEEMEMITQPYIVPLSGFTDTKVKVLNSYLYGYNTEGRDINPSKFCFKLEDAELSVSWLLNDLGTIKLDFNAEYYATPYEDHVDSNIRNTKHLFLNLDRPGDSGYLMLYTTGTQRRWYKLFIKNISDANHPRFVLRSMDCDESKSTAPLIGLTSKMLKSGSKPKVQVLKLEGFETKFVKLT